MRILLIPPKNNYPDPSPHVDFGLGQGMPYLAGALKAAGHEVFGANMYHLWCHGSAPLTLERILREAIEKYQPHLIGIGGMAPNYFFIRDAIFFARQIAPDIPIVCGGGIITYDSHFIFSQVKPDYGIIGEGEISIVKLVEYLDNGGDLRSIPSLAYWKDGEAVFNEVQYPEKLDELPFPDYGPFDFESYLSLYNQMNNSISHSRYRPRVMPITVGRSCSFKCTFCCKMAKYRTRSIDNTMKEIAYFYEKYQFNILYITDELFSVKDGKALEFCSKVKALKKDLQADFDWSCHLRVSDVNRNLLREMKDAGCVFIGYGFESASNSVLKSMNKGITTEQMLQAIQWTEEAGIGIHANFIFGDVAETPDTIKETTNFYEKYCGDQCVHVFYITPYPGSKLFEYCINKALITDRPGYYESIIHNKGSINMTSMPDDVFYKLTAPVMADEYKCKIASVVSCEKANFETCDRDAPFESRRAFYKIEATCPHCLEHVNYVYPLKMNSSRLITPSIIHYCTQCHRRILLDISKKIPTHHPEDIPYLRFYQQSPYSNYYPFDINKYIMRPIPTPQLLEAHKHFNIVRYANYIYGIAQALGALDIPQLTEDDVEKYQEAGKWFTGSSIEEVKNLINEADKNPKQGIR